MIKTLLVVKETPVDASTVHAVQFIYFFAMRDLCQQGNIITEETKEITANSPEIFVYCIVHPVPRTGHQISRIKYNF